MKNKIVITIVILLLSLTAYFYLNSKSKTDNINLDKTEIQNQNILELSENTSKNLLIKTKPIELTNFGRKIQLLGETEAVPDSILDVPARLSGRITQVNFVEGDFIKKGKVLVVIDSPELAKLRSNYITAKSKLFAAQQNVERIRSLVQMNLAAKQELIDSESNLKVIISEKNASEENLRVNGLGLTDSMSGTYQVIAPRSGKAIFRNAVLGSQVLGNQTLTTIADLSHLWFQGKIFEGDLKFLSEGDIAEVILNAYPDDEFSGTLEHIGEKVDPISRTIHARIVFKNQNNKGKIGLFGKAFIEKSGKQGIKIPTTSLFTLKNQNYVFIKVGSQTFKWTQVQIGNVIDDETEISSGLNANDELVISGGFELKSILFKSTFGEE